MSDYSLARDFFGWLGTFTVGDLADAMGIDDELAARFVRAGTWRIHGGDSILKSTGDFVNGTWRGEEELFQYKPLPPGPTQARTYPPEWAVGVIPGVGEDLRRLGIVRGQPVRIRTDRDTRRLMSTPGARSHVIQREKRFEKMMAEQAANRERARQREIKQKDIGNKHKHKNPEFDF